MNWKVTYARAKETSKVKVWVEAETREEAFGKAEEFEDVKSFLAEGGLHIKSIMSEDTVIQERQTIYEKQLKPKA